MSSPISHWSSSPVSSRGTNEDVLTPTRKVKALLAQFDDSESDHASPDAAARQTRKRSPNAAKSNQKDRGVSNRQEIPVSDDDEDVLAPRGRLAARLQAENPNPPASPSSSIDDSKVYQGVYATLATASYATNSGYKELSGNQDQSSDDQPSRSIPRRRLLKKKISTAEKEEVPPSPHSRSPSPLFFPSPSAVPARPTSSQSETRSGVHTNPHDSTAGGKSKFFALVEKHRKQRLGKEAADIAKRAAGRAISEIDSDHTSPRRGSSPADDTEEESDISGAESTKILAQKSRPMRTASKKAVEEMKRETQRMSRNNQLAHQARTKKKITKESFLARFNFHTTDDKFDNTIDNVAVITSGSSLPSSDAEVSKSHQTPPTSPLQHDSPYKDLARLTNEQTSTSPTTFSLHVDHEPLPIAAVKQLLHEPEKGKVKAVETAIFSKAAHPEKKRSRPIRVTWSKQDAIAAHATDSNSDLEIITSQSRTRKFAVFENIPRKKAKETESHLALRALAHLNGSDDKRKSSLNTVEMEKSLLRSARIQAQRERQEKVEALRAKGVVIQTAEERERDQQEVEDLVERARQEAAEIQKREKALAKKDGTFVKDRLGDDESDDGEDGDFEDDDDDDKEEVAELSATDEELSEEGSDIEDNDDVDEIATLQGDDGGLIDAEADEHDSEESEEDEEGSLAAENQEDVNEEVFKLGVNPSVSRSRKTYIVSDDEEELPEGEDSSLIAPLKTPQSLTRSERKQIPGLHMSDDLPMGLTQAFAATMADSQTQDGLTTEQELDSFSMVQDLPSPKLAFGPRLNRFDSIDLVSDSQPASQTQPLNVNLSFSQSQIIPQSPAFGFGISGTQLPATQMPFEPTQDAGYMVSPFMGNRFDLDTPARQPPQSTVETVILPDGDESSPTLLKKGRLIRGRATSDGNDDIQDVVANSKSAFSIMRDASKQKTSDLMFDKSKSAAKDIVDDAAEESEDEYAGLGGASDDDAGDEENDEDRQMIDHDTQVGAGDEAKLAGLFADRERKQDEAAVSKLLKDITTGALRRKRGVGNDLDLSDEEDAAARRREAKRREFAKMRRELLKDEAVGKIAEDKKKEAFLKSIEDRETEDGDEDDFDAPETPLEDESQSQSLQLEANCEKASFQTTNAAATAVQNHRGILEDAPGSTLNRPLPSLRRAVVNKRPATLAEIRENISFITEEPDSQSNTVDLGISDSEEEPEAYVDLDRHLKEADYEQENDAEDLGDFIVDDDGLARDDEGSSFFKKPDLPEKRPTFSERRTKSRSNVVDRLQLIRQASSASSSQSLSIGGNGGKMAFFTSRSSSMDSGSFGAGKVPNLLRRATTNSTSSLHSLVARSGEQVSATGVTTSNGTERGRAEEKEYVRKGTGGRRNAVNYRAKPAEEMAKKVASGGVKKNVKAKIGKGMKSTGGFLGGLFRGNSWE